MFWHAASFLDLASRKAAALGGNGEKGLPEFEVATGDLSFPAEVQDEMGYALGLAQLGARHPNAKPWKGEGPGILEIVEDHRGDTTVTLSARSMRCALPMWCTCCTPSRRNRSRASSRSKRT